MSAASAHYRAPPSSAHPSPGSPDTDNDDVNSSADESGADAGAPPRKRARRDHHDGGPVGGAGGPGRPLSVSCETCKLRKVKCDRGQPSCGWCLKNAQSCEYKERKKPGLRAGYGRELESKLSEQAAMLSHFKEVLERHDSAISQLLASSPTVGPTSASSERTPFHSPSFPTGRVQRPVFLPRPSFTLVDTEPEQTPERKPSLNGNTVQFVTSGLRNGNSLNQFQPVSEAQPWNDEFPDYDICYSLCDLYFQCVNTWLPILHQQRTMETLFERQPLEEDDKILLHAIIVTSLRFSNHERLTEKHRVRQHQLSMEKVQLYGLKNSSVTALQALVIVTLDVVGDSNGPPGWNMLALITRSAVHLGLAVELTSHSTASVAPSIYTQRAMILSEPTDFIEDESRRRLLWAIYILDRYATVATAFDFALSEKDVERRLPCRDDFFVNNNAVETPWFRAGAVLSGGGHLGVFSYFVQLIGILSRIHDFLREPVDIGAMQDVARWQSKYCELDKELQTWHYSLPPNLRNISILFESNPPPGVVDGGLILLHVTYYTTIIRLHSSAAYPTTKTSIFQPSLSAATQCQTAVQYIADVLDFTRAHSPALLERATGPYFAFSLWVAARVLLVHGSTVDTRRGVHAHVVDALVDALRRIGRAWKVAERYANLLQRVLDEWRESKMAGVRRGSETPKSVRLLADMRRTAFDLDALIARAPRTLLAASSANAAPPAPPPPVAPAAPIDARHAEAAAAAAAAAAANAAVANAAAAAAAAAAAGISSPARTPAPADFEYLDLFDFFNYPRLPASLDGVVSHVTATAVDGAPAAPDGSYDGMGNDWLSQQHTLRAV